MATYTGCFAIAGKPNAGKSSLMNAILGTDISIVTPKAQTTRKRVLGIYSDDEHQLIFLDTPGLLTPKYEMQRRMMSYVENSLQDADGILFIIDIDVSAGELDPVTEEFLEEAKKTGKPIIAVLNKIDLYKNIKDVLPIVSRYSALGYFKEIIPVSALRKTNINDLIATLIKYLPEGPFLFPADDLSNQNERFFVSEIIRRQIYLALRQELPYSSEVIITRFKEKEHGKWVINADIIVARHSQKLIMVGNDGSRIKQIGEKARLEIEEHLQQPVYLELFVKVRKDWRDNPTFLNSYGY